MWENTPVNVVQLPVTKIARTGRGGWTVLVMIKGKGKVTEHQDVIVQGIAFGGCERALPETLSTWCNIY